MYLFPTSDFLPDTTSMNHNRLFLCATFSFAIFTSAASRTEAMQPPVDKLAQAFKRYPEADTNKDGVLSEAEARAHLKKLRSGKEGESKGTTPNAAASAAGPEPTFVDVHYGPYDRNVLDFWKANSEQPTAIVVFIHGGGFVSGDKSKARGDRMLRDCLDSGVSYAAINYRYVSSAPILDVLHDCARAIQFIRSKAGEWNVDKTRIAAHGGSAGAGTSLWLAFHDDLADPNSSDLVLRESSRLVAAGASACQFSYDVLEWDKLFGESNNKYSEISNRPAFYGLKTDQEMQGSVGQKLRAECDMRGLISRDDPPVFLNSAMPGGDITSRGHLLHHPLHAKAIYDRCHEVGVGVVAQIPGIDIVPGKEDPQSLREFMFKVLKVENKALRPEKPPSSK